MKINLERDESGKWKSFKLKKSDDTITQRSSAYGASKQIHDKKVDLMSNFDGEKIDNNWRSADSD